MSEMQSQVTWLRSSKSTLNYLLVVITQLNIALESSILKGYLLIILDLKRL